jgi:hypothetical protein
MRAHVLAVLVIFNKEPAAVPGLPLLLRALREIPHGNELALRHLLIYDNSPHSQSSSVAHFPAEVQYVHDPGNGGTRAAYLAALTLALGLGVEWMLLLDHDTELPVDFLEQTSRCLENQTDRQTVAAIVPIVWVNGRIASPARISPFGRVTPIRAGSDLRPPAATAIASGALVRTRALAAITPIPETFRLDYLDHWIFRALQSHGHRLAVSTANIGHALSVWSMNCVPPERFHNILRAEHEFLRSSGRYSKVAYTCWMVLRTMRIAVQTWRTPLLSVCVSHMKAIIR